MNNELPGYIAQQQNVRSNSGQPPLRTTILKAHGAFQAAMPQAAADNGGADSCGGCSICTLASLGGEGPLSWLSLLTNTNDTNTTAAPIQYTKLEYWPYWIISPMSDSGIVRDRPTVTTSGVVKSMANAHDRSLANEASELT